MIPVVCVASGPSFTEEQAALIVQAKAAGKCHVVVVNDNYRRVPNADVLFAADHKWWAHWIEDVREKFPGELWTICPDAARDFGLCRIKGRGRHGLSTEKGTIHTGSNSGYQAINLAWQFGAENFILVGYDMMRGENDEAHWFGSHPEGMGQADPAYFVPYFKTLYADMVRLGLRVVNCSPRTALDFIPSADLATELA